MSATEFQDWLFKNRSHLADYEAWEVARLALAVGFSIPEIAPDAVDWVTKSRRQLKLWESPFFPYWVDLWSYEASGVEHEP